MTTTSLKARLTALVIATVAVIWLATAVFTWFEARHEIDEMLDGHLAQAASLLIVQMGHESDESDEIDTEHPAAAQVRTQGGVSGLGGWSSANSANAPSVPLGRDTAGFSDRQIDGQRWRVFSSWDAKGEMLVHVGEHVDARQELAGDLAGGMLRPSRSSRGRRVLQTRH